MARRVKKISWAERISSWRSNRKAREKRLAAIRNWNWVAIVKVAAVICFLAASGAFLRYAEGYVERAAPLEEGGLKLVGVPEWVNWDLKKTVADIAGGTRFPLTEETASVVARNLASMSWLADVNVRVTHDSVLVGARWRKPVVVIDVPETASKIYVDKDLVVMDYLPMPHLPIVEAKNVWQNIVPPRGQTFDQGDVAAAVTLAVLLNRMDTELMKRTDIEAAQKTPVLELIASIDVGNYKGRNDARKEHIVLWSKDGAEIIWGAEFGEYATYAEANDEEKLAKLYGYLREFGSFGGQAKYINLRVPQGKLHQPIDKYRQSAPSRGTSLSATKGR